MYTEVLTAFSLSFTPEVILVLFIGVVFGAIIGAMPGLGTCVAIVVCLPFTLKLDHIASIALLMGVYGSSIYGGSISAVLINTPGTPQSAATGMDGYPMAKQGLARQALGWVTASSITGGLLSCVALIVAAPQLARLSLKYGGPLEICGLICMGLACISSLSEGNQIKGILMGIAGLLLAAIGNDPVSGEMRFLFGTEELSAGISLMPVVVGIFPLAEVFYRIHEMRTQEEVTPIHCKSLKFPKLKEWKGRKLNLLRLLHDRYRPGYFTWRGRHGLDLRELHHGQKVLEIRGPIWKRRTRWVDRGRIVQQRHHRRGLDPDHGPGHSR